MRLNPIDPIAGEQIKVTSKRPQTLMPQWDPAEKFQYIVSSRKKSKLVFSVYHFTGTSDPTPMGDGSLALQGIGEDPIEKKVQLMNPSTGKPKGYVVVEVYTRTAAEVGHEEEHHIFQYQTWGNFSGWTDSLSPGECNTV